MELDDLSPDVRARVQKWLTGPYDEKSKKEIRHLLKKDPEKLEEAFFKDLAFGTGGMRGEMGVGTNRLNIYTIQRIAQALANYLEKQPKKRPRHRVAIGYDNRLHSAEFGKSCARVLAGSDIEVYLFSHLRPTPFLSFACIYYHCSAGVMITASHNPPSHNGFKVYWEDGSQLLPPHDVGIMKEMEKIEELSDIQFAGLKSPLIKKIPPSFDEIFIQSSEAMRSYPKENGKGLKIVYTSLHGTGSAVIPKALKEWGFSNTHLVKKQCVADPHFSYALSPNPEEKSALAMGVEELMKKKGDILLATDPDADRVGVVAREEDKAIHFSGNQVACLCLSHLLEAGTHVQENTAFIKTIVTSELFKEIAFHHDKRCYDVLPGFKYIGALIGLWEQKKGAHFLFGGEDSCGYLLGSFLRDKDAVTASCLVAEMALHLKKKKKTLYRELLSLYEKYGVFREKLTSFDFPNSPDGAAKIKKTMQKLRGAPPKSFLKKKVVLLEDYQLGEAHDLTTGKKTPLTLPKSDVLRFWLEDQSKLVLRPSGTEAKIKLYAGVQKKRFATLKGAIAEMDEYQGALIKELCTHLG